MSLLGSFWHEGDSAKAIAIMLPSYPERNTRQVISPDQQISLNLTILESLQELGYLGQDGSTSVWDISTSVHPMLSLYARLSLAHGHERSAPSATEHDQTDPFSTSLNPIMALDWQHIFLISVGKSMRERWNVPREPTGPSNHRYVLGVTNLPNILNCIDVCIKKDSPLPLVHWPLKLFEQLALVLPDVGSEVEYQLFARRFELLLAAFFDALGSIEVPIAYQSFAATAQALAMSAYKRQGIKSPEGFKQLTDRGIQVYKATERKYGPPSNRDVLFETICLYLLDTSANLNLGSAREARASWQEAMKLIDHLEDGDSTAAGGNEINFLAADGENILEWMICAVMGMGPMQNCTDGPSALDVEKPSIQVLKSQAAFMEKQISAMERISESEQNAGAVRDLAAELEHEAMKIQIETSACLDSGYELQGLARQVPNSLQSLLATDSGVNSQDKFGEASMQSHLEWMEKSSDIGDWKDVVRHRKFFLKAARHNLDFKQMAFHANALHDIYSHSPAAFTGELELEEIQFYKRFLDPLLQDVPWSDPPANGQHTGVRMKPKMATELILEGLGSVKGKSNDAARLHELSLRAFERMSSKKRFDEEIQIPLPQYRNSGGSMKRAIEFMELHLKIKDTAEARDWKKIFPLLNEIFKYISDYFGGNNSAVLRAIEDVRTWLQVSLPLLEQLDQALENSDLPLATSIFSSLQKSPWPELEVLDDIMKDTRNRIQSFSLGRSTFKLDEQHNSSTLEASHITMKKRSRLQRILADFYRLFVAEQDPGILGKFKETIGKCYGWYGGLSGYFLNTTRRVDSEDLEPARLVD